MRNTKSLTILQYNVWNDKMRTMIPLLADMHIQNYDIIAIQEPWCSSLAPKILSSPQNGFHLLYRPGSDTKVCFYINDSINPESWEVDYSSPNMCTLKIIMQTKGILESIYIHNIYNPFPLSYSLTDSPFMLHIGWQQLIANVYYILFSNFNLHHLFWNSLLRPTQHAAVDQLLKA